MLKVYRAGANLLERPLWEKLLNATAFQAVWFTCVLAGDDWALISISLFLLMHCLLMSISREECRLILGVTMTGLLVDSVNISLGVLTVIDDSSNVSFGIAPFNLSPFNIVPLWLMCIWLAFSLTLCHSMSWLQQRLWLAGLLGALSVPLSYWAGIKLGAMALGPLGYFGLIIMGCVWALLLPIFCYFAAKVPISGALR